MHSSLGIIMFGGSKQLAAYILSQYFCTNKNGVFWREPPNCTPILNLILKFREKKNIFTTFISKVVNTRSFCILAPSKRKSHKFHHLVLLRYKSFYKCIYIYYSPFCHFVRQNCAVILCIFIGMLRHLQY